MTEEAPVAEEWQEQRPLWFSRLDRWAQVSWRLLIVVAAIAVTAWLLTQLRVVVVPMVFALFICTVLVPVQRFFLGLRLPRAAASLLAVLVGFLGLGLIVLLIIPPVVQEWDDLVDSVGRAYDDIFVWLEEGPVGLNPGQVEDLRTAIEEFQDQALAAIAEGAVAGLPVIVEVLGGIVLAIVISFYFLLDGARLWGWLVQRLPKGDQPRVHQAGLRAWWTLSRYLRGLALVALVDAIGIGLGAWVLGVPLVVPIAVLTLITAFVPIIGAVAAGVVAILIALADGGFETAIWMLVVVVAVQQLESNVVAPLLVGRAVQLHPLMVLLGVVAGGAIAGILGAIMVTPLIAVLFVLIRELSGESKADDHADDDHEHLGPAGAGHEHDGDHEGERLPNPV